MVNKTGSFPKTSTSTRFINIGPERTSIDIKAAKSNALLYQFCESRFSGAKIDVAKITD